MNIISFTLCKLNQLSNDKDDIYDVMFWIIRFWKQYIERAHWIIFNYLNSNCILLAECIELVQIVSPFK